MKEDEKLRKIDELRMEEIRKKKHKKRKRN